MDDSSNIQNKISSLVKERQTQLSELKCFYDNRNKRLYKEIVLLSGNLQYFEELFNNKAEFRLKIENLLSLSLSFGKILDLNHPVKTILLGLKIFEEHESYLKQNSNLQTNTQGVIPMKSFISKMFEKTEVLPLMKNDFLKSKFIQSGSNKYQMNDNISNSSSSAVTSCKDFYQALYRNDINYWNDFNKYLNFQMDQKQKPKETQLKMEDFSNKLYKLYHGSNANYYKFYTRCIPVCFIFIKVVI
jgi:hypothetical protein